MKPLKEKTAEAISILTRACAQNFPLDLRIVGEKSTGEYRSRFLNLDDTREGLILTIEAPSSSGNIVPVRPGQEIKVSFSYDGRGMSFTTHIRGRGKFSLSSAVSVPSLNILVPENVSIRERRGFYRLLVTDLPPIEITMGVFSGEGTRRRIRSREKGVMTDLGGGGLGFRISEGKSLLLALGTRLSLSFQLPDDEQEIKIIGRTCFSLRRSELREIFFGVQFVETESNIEYKQSIDKILRFVAERQRRMLKERIHPSF